MYVLSFSLSIYLSVCLFVCLSVCLSIYPSICLSIHLSIHPSIYMHMRLRVSEARTTFHGPVWAPLRCLDPSRSRSAAAEDAMTLCQGRRRISSDRVSVDQLGMVTQWCPYNHGKTIGKWWFNGI